MMSILNISVFKDIFVAPRELWVSSVFQNLLGRMMVVMSVSSWGVIWLALAMVIWSINRQTQIRPSASQASQRPADGKDRQDQMNKSHRIKSFESDNDDDLYFHDWNRRKSRINLFDSEDDTSDYEEGSYSEECEFEGSKTPHSGLSRGDPDKRDVSRDLIRVLSKLKVFSYLSDDAFIKIIDHVEYVDLPKKGMTLISRSGESKEEKDLPKEGKTLLRSRSRGSKKETQIECEEEKPLDGSLFVVISGALSITCKLQVEAAPSHELNLTARKGDIVTSYLAMLSGLIRQYQHREDQKKISSTRDKLGLEGIHATNVHAVSLEDNTRLIRISPTVFLSMLDTFPHEVSQIVHTILARTQRVTIQTLVNNLGLGHEILHSHFHDDKGDCDDKNAKPGYEASCQESANIQNKLINSQSSERIDYEALIKQDACKMAASRLGEVDSECVTLIKDASSVISVSPGEVILQSGEQVNFMYLVLNGELEVGTEGIHPTNGKGLGATISNKFNDGDTSPHWHTMYKAEAGDLVGELECFTQDMSFITVRAIPNATEPTILLQIPKTSFNHLLSTYPSILIRCLNDILTDDFSPIVHLLDWGIQWKHVQAGDIVAKKGQPCQCLSVVLNGRLRASENEFQTSRDDGLDRGSCFGDLEVITGDNWSSDIYAIRNSELAKLPTDVLETIMHIFPSAGLHFAKVIAQKVKRQREEIEPNERQSLSPSSKLSFSTVAIIPFCFANQLEDESLDFCNVVVSSLQKIASCTLMTKEIARKSLGDKVFNVRNSVHETKMARLLGDMEENYRMVVFQAESEYSWWTKLCIQQADCVLLVCSNDAVPRSQRLEKYLAWAYKSQHVRRIQLVVLQQVIGKPICPSNSDKVLEERIPVSGALNDWSENRHWIHGHHLIRVPLNAHTMDVNRMCRRITGRSIGLVLGGGGARGIAHLGVIRALIEAGVSVDMVGGTSQGSFIGGT